MGTSPRSDNDYLLELNAKNLARAIAWISVVDAKAKFVLTVVILILGYAVSRLKAIAQTTMSQWASQKLAVLLVDAALLGAFVCLFVSCWYLMRIIYPKRSPYTRERSYFFFQTISEMRPDDFICKMAQMPLDEAVRGIAEQTYNVSQVVSAKLEELVTSVRWFWCGFWSFLAFFFLNALLL